MAHGILNRPNTQINQYKSARAKNSTNMQKHTGKHTALGIKKKTFKPIVGGGDKSKKS